MHRYARVLPSFLPVLFVPEAHAQDPLNELVGAYPYSIMRGAACTKDGQYLYLAEGGSIAFLDTEDAQGQPSQAGMDDEISRSPVGRLGAIGVRMMLDPDAADPPTDGANDLLYIAGGRDGHPADVWTWGDLPGDIPPSTLDEFPQNVNSVEVDKTDPEEKVAYVYVGIRRTGLQILKLEPSNTLDPLSEVEFIQTPGNAWDVIVRPENGSRPRQLFVGDLEGGIRVYEEE